MREKGLFDNVQSSLTRGRFQQLSQKIHFGRITQVYPDSGLVDVEVDGIGRKLEKGIPINFGTMGDRSGTRHIPEAGQIILLYGTFHKYVHIGGYNVTLFKDIEKLEVAIDENNGKLVQLKAGEWATQFYQSFLALRKEGFRLNVEGDFNQVWKAIFKQVKSEAWHYTKRTMDRRSRQAIGRILRLDHLSTVGEDTYQVGYEFDELYEVVNEPIVAGEIWERDAGTEKDAFYQKHISPLILDNPGTGVLPPEPIESKNLKTAENLIWFERISHTPFVGEPTETVPFAISPTLGTQRDNEITTEIGESGAYNKKRQFSPGGVETASVETDITDKADVKHEVIADIVGNSKKYTFDFSSEDGALTFTVKHETVTHTVTLDEDELKLEDSDGNHITIDKKNSSIIIEDKHGNNVTTDSSGMVIEDKNSNKVTLSSTGTKIEAKGNTFEMGASSTTINGNFEVLK